MKKILIIIAHPNFDNSLSNKSIINALESNLEKKNIRNLSELYPDFKIDVKAEQAALLAADHIVLQFPFYWYSVPPILKQWIDLVLEYGFAFGEGGDKLKGKNLIVSTTTGTPTEAYQKNGANRYTMEEFLAPIEQTVNLCQMNYLTPVRSHSMMAYTEADQKAIVEKAIDHANRLSKLFLVELEEVA